MTQLLILKINVMNVAINMTRLLILKINVMNVAGRRRRRRMAERAQLQWKGCAIY